MAMLEKNKLTKSVAKRALKQGGFSMSELLVTVAIMGTLASVGTPYFSKAENKVNDEVINKAASQMVDIHNDGILTLKPADAGSCKNVALLAGVNLNEVTVDTDATDCTLTQGKQKVKVGLATITIDNNEDVTRAVVKTAS